MDHQKKISHLIIKFNEKNKQGKDIIDLVPISWTFNKDSELYCKYPDKNEYHKIDQMCKKSLGCDTLWSDFKISVVKEAYNYDQGVRRMKKAFSDNLVQSSMEDQYNSSEKEESPQILSGNDLRKCLNDIPSFSGDAFKLTSLRVGNDEDNSLQCDKYYTEEFSYSDTSSLSLNSKHKKTLNTIDKHNSKTTFPPKKAKQGFPIITKNRMDIKSLLKNKKNKKDIDCSKSEMFNDKEYSDDTSSSLDSYHQKPYKKTKNHYSQSNVHSKIKNQKDQMDSKKEQPYNYSIVEKKPYIQKPCPTCGALASDSLASKDYLDLVKRSIEYRIKEEAKITRSLISAHFNNTDIEKIMLEETIVDLPKCSIETFQEFDNQLQTDLDLIKKLKCFMVLNIKSSAKLSENLSLVIPQIMKKNVQLLYSAYGRENNGIKKLNFSATETYKHLLEILTTKYPGVKYQEISSQISRWFSGAKDREGGKKARLYRKMLDNENKDVSNI